MDWMDALSSDLSAWAQWCQAFLAQGTRRVVFSLQTMWTNPASALFWVYCLASLGWARLAFSKSYDGHGLRAFLRFCFPRQVYLHRSTSTDLQLFFLNGFLNLPRLLLKGLGPALVAAWLLGLEWSDVGEYSLGPFSSLAFWGLLLAAANLGYYINHRLHHQVPFLWEFHKVHHSAEVLTPLTLWRKHPVFDITTAIASTTVRGCLYAGIVLLFGVKISAVHLLGFNLWFTVYRLAGQHLRHSHIWLAWPAAVSHVFLSPAQHQIHHSYDPRHLNKNFGEVFALWDWLFGTLYVAREKEDLRFGLGEEKPEISNALRAYVIPFRNVGRMVGRRAKLVLRGSR